MLVAVATVLPVALHVGVKFDPVEGAVFPVLISDDELINVVEVDVTVNVLLVVVTTVVPRDSKFSSNVDAYLISI